VNKTIALDASPIGRLVHPRLNKDISAWLDEALRAGFTIYLPEITDYEVRRGLLAAGLTRSITRLDQFKQALEYLPIATPVMLEAATLWAQARKRGQSVADPKELDGDVILAAQARQVDAIVITENVGRLAQFVTAFDWRTTTVAELMK